MNYYTTKDTETGKKISSLYVKKKNAIKFKKAFYKKHGLIVWFSSTLDVLGLFLKGEELPEIPNYRRIRNVYFPKKNTKEGKLILKEFEGNVKITPEDLREIGINNIYDFNDLFIKKDLCGVMTYTGKGLQIPNDCIKIEDEVFLQYFPNSKDSFLPF